jgi:hypothetical protein
MPAAFIAQIVEEILARKIKTGVGGDRFEDDSGDRFRILPKGGANGFDVIERERNRQRGKFAGHSGAVRAAMSQRATAGLDEQGVHVAVITAFKLDDLIAAGEAARQAKTGHGRFRAAVDHAHLFDRGHPAADKLGHFDFERVRNAEAEPTSRGRGDSLYDNRGGVPENRGAPRADIIDVFVPVDIPNPRAFGPIDEKGVAIQPAKGADRRINAARDAPQGSSEKLG